jgi:hypothetical protein
MIVDRSFEAAVSDEVMANDSRRIVASAWNFAE